MKKMYAIAAILSAFAISAKPVEQPPKAEITNGLIRASLYLPDAAYGYYRGSRFDWSGVMPELEYNGHSYFGQWFDKYSPTLHDAIMGPVEAFSPVGYQDVKAGENFLMIGIGMVTKLQEAKYSFVNPYQIANPGTWKIKKKSDRVEFLHKLEDNQYAYRYKKTIQLIKGQPTLVLSHTLENTGKQDIETDVYNHNFFVIDKQTVGPDYIVQFPFNLSGEQQGKGDLGKLQDNRILFSKELGKNDHLYYGSLLGFGTSAKDYDIKIENQKTGAGVRITCDRPLSKVVFWSAHATLCPEPYIKIKVAPGAKQSWKIFYDFYTTAKNP